MVDSVEEVFKKLKLETEEKRQKFNFILDELDEEINVNGLGLSTYS